MSFGVQGPAGGDLGHVHPGDPLLALELDVGAGAAQAGPGLTGYLSYVLYAVALDDRDTLLLDEEPVAGLSRYLCSLHDGSSPVATAVRMRGESALLVDHRRHLGLDALPLQGLLPALTDLRVLLLVLDDGAPLFQAHQGPVQLPAGSEVEADRVSAAAEA